MKKLLLFLSLIAFIALIGSTSSFAQTQRNPVLEEFTGTWCQWCPCGHDIMEQIKAAIPNSIMIGYHGPANGSDPFSYFSGNSVIGMLSPPFWPSGTPDRTGAPGSRGSWLSQMTTRNSVPATVAIDVDHSFNKVTREFTASIDFTALTNLSGQYMFTVVLLEDGLVWSQAGNGSCPGGSNYVHNHVVRDMMNGAMGEEIINGTWNANDVINKTVNRTVPSPGGAGPDMVWDSCHVVVMVHESASPLYNGEIQQAEEFVLVSPDYVATAASMSPDIIGGNDTPGQYSIILKNEGLLNDAYNINCTLDGPAGWTGEFTTVNGTYPFGQIDSVQVASGDSTEITLMINPNSFNGSGTATLEFESRNGPGIVGSVTVSYVTNTGVHLLVVDASEDGHASMITSTLDSFYVGRYGAVSRSALQVPGLDLSYFTMISWSAGDAGSSAPAFFPDEVSNLEAYLDQGGNLFLNGQNVGEDIFEPTGQSQFAQSFFNNYLHANYVADIGPSFFFRGIDSDPITDGIVFSLQSIYTMHPDEISPNGPDANTILTYGTGPSINSIKADDGNHKVVYFGIGFEQINDAGGIVDSLVARSVRWLTEGIVLNNRNENQVVSSYSLQQNYPNPFNPSTTITYSLAEEVKVNLKIYDVMGREITELVNEKQNAGSHHYYFDASNLSSGIYFYKLTAGDFISVKKMTLLK